LTKGKVIQIGIVISLVGFLSFYLAPLLGLDNLNPISISNFVLITIVLSWVTTYLFRVLNGNMTFMEQRKRYRKEYENIMNEKITKKFESLSDQDQQKLLKGLEED
tara:strand:+ start:273 stop:590 length:318 start_codon:yes stop_codon:yes gene_type:complete